MKKLLLIKSFLIFMLLTSFTLEWQKASTSLRITVRDDLGNLVENATVVLYKTEADYKNEKNPAVEAAKTNVKGEARFRNLDPIAYFVDVQKGDLSNDGGGVRLKRLDKGKANRITVIIQ
jgi:hypothetical protein